MPETEQEQAAYHAVSVVGTLLLQIGEVGKKFEKVNLEDGDSKQVAQETGSSEKEWKITFEQFLASILTEAILVEELTKKVDLEEALKNFNTGGSADFKKENSVETTNKSVFYV